MLRDHLPASRTEAGVSQAVRLEAEGPKIHKRPGLTIRDDDDRLSALNNERLASGFANVRDLHRRTKAADIRRQLVPFGGTAHGFFKFGRDGGNAYAKTVRPMDKSLEDRRGNLSHSPLRLPRTHTTVKTLPLSGLSENQ